MTPQITQNQRNKIEAALDTALRNVGTQAKIAELIGVGQPLISNYFHGARIKAEHAIEMEKQLGISREVLRPDLFFK